MGPVAAGDGLSGGAGAVAAAVLAGGAGRRMGATKQPCRWAGWSWRSSFLGDSKNRDQDRRDRSPRRHVFGVVLAQVVEDQVGHALG